MIYYHKCTHGADMSYFQYKQCATSRQNKRSVNRTRSYQEAFRKYVLKYILTLRYGFLKCFTMFGKYIALDAIRRTTTTTIKRSVSVH